MYAFLAATFCTVNVLLILCNAQWNIVMMKSNETCCFFALSSVVYIPMVASAKYLWIETIVYLVYNNRYSETFQNLLFTYTAYTTSRHIILLVVEYKNLKNSLSKWQQRAKEFWIAKRDKPQELLSTTEFLKIFIRGFMYLRRPI